MRRIGPTLVSVVCAVALFGPSAAASAAPAAPPRPPVPGTVAKAPTEDPDRVLDPDRKLGAGWRASPDRAVTSSGDETGFQLLVADAGKAYRWRTAASLSEPGVQTDQWIGQFCLTGSGQRAVVVYAPRQFTNREDLMRGGAFAAVVDLRTGAVTKLRERVSLAYYNPGCGAGETAVLSRLEHAATGGVVTWLGQVDTTRPTHVVAVRAPGQVTSTLPYDGGLLGVQGYSLVRVSADAATPVATLPGSPFRLLADGTGAVAFQVARGNETDLSRYADGAARVVATVPMGSVKLRAGAGGRVFAVGGRARSRTATKLPTGWRAIDSVPDSTVSTTGALVVSAAGTGKEAAGGQSSGAADGIADRVSISAKLANGQDLGFAVQPDKAAHGGEPSPALPASATAGGQQTRVGPPGPANLPYDLDRSCSVPRNDPAIQVFQPTVKQVEWAADLAVRGMLTFQRPANWSNNNMPAYTPQGLFPSKQLVGGGRVPVQIMLGIMAQESNLWQASSHAVDASVGNPLVSSGFYGIPADGGQDPRTIDMRRTDCGYGVAQVTTGMRADETDTTIDGIVWDYPKQKLVALDYAVNISAGLRILQDKWNVTRSAGLIANDGDPKYLENWWFALWAYNTGFYPQNGNAPWGLGWGNNTANQDYPADRKMFLTEPLDVPDPDGAGPRKGYDDVIGYDIAKHPNDWTYPERVIGFAYTSMIRFNYAEDKWDSTYATARTDSDERMFAQPARFQFCAVAVNECDPAAQHVPGGFPGTKPGACLRDDLFCRWHGPATWADCPDKCGQENLRYLNVEPRPYVEDGDNIYPTPVNDDGTCKVEGLPTTAKIIDDISTTAVLGAEGCRPTFARGGTFELQFGSMVGVAGGTIYPSKVDFHQIGAGFGGHFWFGHTMLNRDPVTGATNDPLKVTGTWSINPTAKWTRVYVHVPDNGAHTAQADYKVFLPGETVSTHHRVLPTRWEENKWLELGVFDFRAGGTPKITLDNITRDGAYVDDIAWDAIAVEPLAAKPRHFVVGLGDSYASGEGAWGYSRVSDQYGDDKDNKNGCHRSEEAWIRQIVIPNTPAGKDVGTLADSFDTNMDFHHLACSDTRTFEVMATTDMNGVPAKVTKGGYFPRGKDVELTQLDQGYLDENTTLVALTVGGNDAYWSDVFMDCGNNDCLDPNFKMPGDSLPYIQRVETRIHTAVYDDVRRVITEIKERAPNAQVILAGYPQLLKTGTEYRFGADPLSLFAVDYDEVAWMNRMVEQMAVDVLFDDPARKIKSVDVRAKFAGHEVGADIFHTQYIHGAMIGDRFLLPDDDGEESDLEVQRESFHPNPAGQTAYAEEVTVGLGQTTYTW